MTNLEKFIEEKVEEVNGYFCSSCRADEEHEIRNCGGEAPEAYFAKARVRSSLHALLAEIKKEVIELPGIEYGSGAGWGELGISRKMVLALLHPSEPKEE